jgi:hypothetical protein
VRRQCAFITLPRKILQGFAPLRSQHGRGMLDSLQRWFSCDCSLVLGCSELYGLGTSSLATSLVSAGELATSPGSYQASLSTDLERQACLFGVRLARLLFFGPHGLAGRSPHASELIFFGSLCRP